jgi:hypothetical protein
VLGHQEDGKCLVLGDSVIRNVGTDSSDMMVECFFGALERNSCVE